MTSKEQSSTPKQDAPQNDHFLQFLVNIVNNSTCEFEIRITLQVSGMLVSGHLVNSQAFFNSFGNKFTSAFEDSTHAETIRKSFSEFSVITREGSEQQAHDAQPQYIHIKNGHFFNTAGKPIPRNKGVWWRGRICEVGGFFLGTLIAEHS